ncbi:uncharacterized protein EAF02_003917 [Botrytis sinoallii]|uniref:uncharacterized protein n=1 Tax=Botrytis sinoallii TaxID=1463999 RepID=UPI0018FF6E5F|nr:uncharacterized protein EAF02_003917 [Botrytis sinoallii]KAF7885408.1 hypothetical protein EAF02_003917 [Botrytis sinoallii]
MDGIFNKVIASIFLAMITESYSPTGALIIVPIIILLLYRKFITRHSSLEDTYDGAWSDLETTRSGGSSFQPQYGTLHLNNQKLYEPEVEPLRIIKRSQTVTSRISSSRFGGADEWGMAGSPFDDEGEGSPPVAADRPLVSLTIHKIRRGKGRGSILDDSDLSIKIVDIVKQDHPDYSKDDFELTPKASEAQRKISTGNFLRTELHSLSSEKDVESADIRKLAGSPVVPQRKKSKSKYSLLRAFGGRRIEDLDSNPTLDRSHFSTSTKSHSTLLRKLSRRKSSASTIQSMASLSVRTVELANPFDTIDNQNINDSRTNSRISSYYDGTIIMSNPPTPTPTPTLVPTISSSREDNFVLCPQISVTPESASVNAGVCTLWAAVEITGVLRKADGTSTLDDAGRTYSTKDLTSRYLDLRSYGSLHNIAVEFQPGPDCIIVDQPADTFQAKTIRTLGFLKLKIASCRGEFRLLPQHTLLETKATASIKRHNPASAWSPRSSGTLNSAVGASVLTKIIEKHFSAEKSKEALQSSRKIEQQFHILEEPTDICRIRKIGNLQRAHCHV